MHKIYTAKSGMKPAEISININNNNKVKWANVKESGLQNYTE